MPGVRGAAVFPEINALPRAEHEASRRKRYALAGPSERHLDVTRHVVGSLERVLEMRIILRHEPIKPGLEIGARRGVGVFHDHEAATRVLAKHRNDALREFAATDFARH